MSHIELAVDNSVAYRW